MKIQHLSKGFILGTTALAAGCNQIPKEKDSNHPNIIIFYVDDLGYGDVGCYGATRVQTPNIDLLANNGVRFTDAHCSAATSTPSRYSLLTGRYAFRKNARVLPGNAPLLISPDRQTLPDILKSAGYATSIVGKWHLGLGDGNINWNDSIAPGPNEVGFDYSFIIPATGDRVPCVFVEDHFVVNGDPDDPIIVSYKDSIGDMPTARSRPDLVKMKSSDNYHNRTLVNGVGRLGYMDGGEKALWVDEEFPSLLTEKAIRFIQQNKDNPFFLFYSFHDIHVPRVIHPDFQGKSEMGPRGDAIVQVDWCVGQIMQVLQDQGLSENTLVIFTSDNGPIWDDGYEDQAFELLDDHKAAGPLRGNKYSAFEAGTRVPTITYWPGKIKPSVNNALMGQVDLLASIAAFTGQSIEQGMGEDGKNFMDTWLGESQIGREYLLEESYTFSIRYNNWKYIQPREPLKWVSRLKAEGGCQLEPQLYNLESDLAEQENLADEYPDLVNQLSSKLDEILEK